MVLCPNRFGRGLTGCVLDNIYIFRHTRRNRPTSRYSPVRMRLSLSNQAHGARERILDAAAEVLAQRGYSAAGVQEIVTRSGTSKGNFYFHFSSKETMVMALVDRMSEKLVRKIQGAIQSQPTPLDRISAGIEALMATFFRQRRVAQVLVLSVIGHGSQVDKKFLPMRDRFSRLLQRELDAAVAEGQIESVNTALISYMWVGALHEVILRWLLVGRTIPVDDAVLTLKSTLLRSIGADLSSHQKRK